MVRKKKAPPPPRLDLGRYEPPGFSDEAPVADVVRDAAVLAFAAVRLTVKNLIIVRALRDHAFYDDRWFLTAIGAEFAVLAAEKERDADRVDAFIEQARDRTGRPAHPADYGRDDLDHLARRSETLRALAAQLVALREDEQAARELLDEARYRALGEIADSIAATLVHTPASSALTGNQRSDALTGLAADIAAAEIEWSRLSESN